VANTINLAADVTAMGDALQLLMGGPDHVYSAVFGVFSLLLQAAPEMAGLDGDRDDGCDSADDVRDAGVKDGIPAVAA
jgi:hypothetical protein